MDCRVKVIGVSSEALSLFETDRPDIVFVDLATRDGLSDLNISDLAQRGISALDIASRIKAVSSSTPVIAVAGWGIAADNEKMKEAGFDFILQKPFRLEQLREIITKYGKSDKIT